MTADGPHAAKWRAQQESNLQSSLRRGKLYPFNYGAKRPKIIKTTPCHGNTLWLIFAFDCAFTLFNTYAEL